MLELFKYQYRAIHSSQAYHRFVGEKLKIIFKIYQKLFRCFYRDILDTIDSQPQNSIFSIWAGQHNILDTLKFKGGHNDISDRKLDFEFGKTTEHKKNPRT